MRVGVEFFFLCVCVLCSLQVHSPPLTFLQTGKEEAHSFVK